MSTDVHSEAGDDLLEKVPSTFARAEITLTGFEQHLGTIAGMLEADVETKTVPLGEADADGKVPVKRTTILTRRDTSKPIENDGARRLLASLIERNGGDAAFY